MQSSPVRFLHSGNHYLATVTGLDSRSPRLYPTRTHLATADNAYRRKPDPD